MSSVQKIKLLALHCATSSASSTATTSPSPSRLSAKATNSAPNTAAPCLNFGRLLGRRLSLNRWRNHANESSMKEGLLTGRHHKLRDLFICSPPSHDDGSADHGSLIKMDHDDLCAAGFGSFSGRVEEQYPIRRRRFGPFRLRYRLSRGAWRPPLGTISE